MPRQPPVGEILNLADEVKYVAVVRLCDCGLDFLLSVHHSAVINILPGSGNINTTIKTPDGEVLLVTVSQSGHFLEENNYWLNSGVYPIHFISPETFTK